MTITISAEQHTAYALQNAAYQAKQTMRRNAVEALAKQHPELVRADSIKGGSLVAAAKNIRHELKQAFPGVKFSVTTSRFSGGDSLRVRWTDGPTIDRVSEITRKYKGGNFNGSEDLYEYNDSAWIDAFGDANYMSLDRDYSPKIQQWINEQIAKFGYNDHWNNPHRILDELNIKAAK